MLMEPVLGGELFTHLRKSGKFKPDKAQFYLAQVALVFEHLHSKNIIFRDLKPGKPTSSTKFLVCLSVCVCVVSIKTLIEYMIFNLFFSPSFPPQQKIY